jgi:hypothetical protein
MLNGLFGRRLGRLKAIHQGSAGQDTWYQNDFSRLERSEAN